MGVLRGDFWEFWCAIDTNTPCWLRLWGRVLARIWRMPVQNSNSKYSARPDLATNLVQILISTTFDWLFCKKDNIHSRPVLEVGLFENISLLPLKKFKLIILHRNFCLSKINISGNCLPKIQARRVLAKSLLWAYWPFSSHHCMTTRWMNTNCVYGHHCLWPLDFSEEEPSDQSHGRVFLASWRLSPYNIQAPGS